MELTAFDQFDRIFLELANRKGFMPSQDLRFFKTIQSDAPPEQKFVLHLAWHDDELVAGHLGSFVGSTAVYLLGASTAKGRDLRASYLLQWQAILYSKSVGNSFYDLGGIDQQNNPDVYRFKRRLNGRRVTEVGPYEFAPGAVSRQVIRFADMARGAIARHRARKG
ncbi:MAG: peptidoglycan bridge formation glycyltransferase FemA/FemB family protein [Alcaligenaceae bacterium]|nr:MAG: peptidoglycan bridge formation glycyltransferase FemA/FemB family protein [Alcaligenaceae bacterium]